MPHSLTDQPHELRLSCASVIAEHTLHGRRDRYRTRCLNTSHSHAEVLCLEHNSHTDRSQLVFQVIGNLLSESLLNLETSSIATNDSGKLGKPHDPLVRNVTDVSLADERNDV